MAFSFANWFRRKSDDDLDNDIVSLLSKINADITRGFESILIKEEDKELIKELYKEIIEYIINVRKDNKLSLINDNYILEAIKINIGNYDVTSKIFNFVKAWDSNSYLPKKLKLILKNQIPDSQIEEIESMYGEYNVLKKETLKDEKNYYYVNSNDVKYRLTKAFGNLINTRRVMLQIKFLDDSRKVSKKIVDKLFSMLLEKDENGEKVNSLRIYKLRNVPVEDVVNNEYLNSIFENGLVNAGNVLEPSDTTVLLNTKLDVLRELKDNTDNFKGFILICIPNKYFDEKGLVKEETEKYLYVDSQYQMIAPYYLKMYVSLTNKRVNLYYRSEFINKQLDLPRLKTSKK